LAAAEEAEVASRAAEGIVARFAKDAFREADEDVVKDVDSTTGRAADRVALHSRSGALSNREVMDGGVGLPRTPETVEKYTRLAGVDFRGAPVEVIENPDDIAYLDYQGAVARTDDLGVQLGPAAFQDEETLVRTLGHESVHVKQYADGRVTTLTGPLEDEAYAAEDGFVETWRRNTR
jgi:hypothetical protein